jgi:hypothetical protein
LAFGGYAALWKQPRNIGGLHWTKDSFMIDGIFTAAFCVLKASF